MFQEIHASHLYYVANFHHKTAECSHQKLALVWKRVQVERPWSTRSPLPLAFWPADQADASGASCKDFVSPDAAKGPHTKVISTSEQQPTADFFHCCIEPSSPHGFWEVRKERVEAEVMRTIKITILNHMQKTSLCSMTRHLEIWNINKIYVNWWHGRMQWVTSMDNACKELS